MTTAGSLGDLYPVLSTAASLIDLGVEVRLLLAPDDCAVARDWGLLATPVGPTRAQICATLGISQDALVRDFLRNPLPFLRRVMVPMTAELMPVLEEACEGAACVSGTMLTFGAAYAAERANLPFVPLVLQPALGWSAMDPPRGLGFDLMVGAPRNAVTLGWNRTVRATMQSVLRLGLSGPVRRLRAGLDLPPDTGVPTIDAGHAHVPLRLGLWSRHFAAVPPDAVPGLVAVGFPRSPKGTLPLGVQRWLDAGPAPLVVSLGSIAQNLARPDFYDQAVALARARGLRSVLLHGEAKLPRDFGDDVLALPAAPHAPLFPQAALIVHHGGMGTTGEAIRSGRPQIVMPVGGDQPDNAARLVDLGLAIRVSRRRFTAARVLPKVQSLLDRFDQDRADALARTVSKEDGASAAARHLARIATGAA